MNGLASILACMPLLLAFAGCTPPGPVGTDSKLYVQALIHAHDIPKAGYQDCRHIRNAILRADCGLAAIEGMAKDPDETTASLLQRCRTVAVGTWLDECAFQVAEKRNDSLACDHAGRFQDDCRLHLFSTGLRSWVSENARVDDPEIGRRAEKEIQKNGLPATDGRAWSAFYRWVLGRQAPLDRAACASIAESERRSICMETGKALYTDRLNHARDSRSFPCQGGAMPTELEVVQDPELLSLRTQRAAQDLCP